MLMILPTKGISPQRSLLSVGGTLIRLLETPATVSTLWERFQQNSTRNGHRSNITFDWFTLALAMLFTVQAVDWNSNQELERSHVPA